MEREICDYYEPISRNYSNKLCKYYTGDNKEVHKSKCRFYCRILSDKKLMNEVDTFKRVKGALRQK